MDTQFPLFIVGSGRCGTSMLLKIINDFSSIAIPAESHFIPIFLKKINQYEPLTEDKNLLRLLNDIKDFPYVRDWDMDFDIHKINDQVVERTYAGVVRAIYTEFARQKGKNRWGDKTPPYLGYISDICKLFPDARFLHIVRDGRDCALSVIKCNWGPNNIYKAAVWWRDSLLKGEVELEKCKTMVDDINSIYLEVRYEDILTNPEKLLKEVFDFIHEPFDKELLSKLKIKTNNKFKWKSKMCIKCQKVFEQVAGDMLDKFNYPRAFKELSPISPILEYYYLFDNRIKSINNIWWDIKRIIQGTMNPK